MKLPVRWIVVALLSLLLTLNIHLLSPAQAQLSLVQAGKQAYEAGQFSQAAQTLQQATQHYGANGDRIHQAQTLSFLSLVYQKLGQWKDAESAITTSLSLLKERNTPQILAQALNTQGHLELSTGKTEAALETWKTAEKLYRQANDPIGILGTRISQAQAMQTLGLYRLAEKQLLQIEKEVSQLNDPSLKAISLQNLGNLYNRVGELTIAKRLLTESLSLTISSNLKSQILFSLGNTERAIARQAEVLKQPEQEQQAYQQALNHYQQAALTSSSAIARSQIQANHLSLLLDRQQPTQTLWSQLESQLLQLPSSRMTIYTHVNASQSLTRLNQPQAAAQLLKRAIQQADELNDQRAKSAALGTLGQVFERSQQWIDAQKLTQQALKIAHTINAPDLTYQWQWQMGRLIQRQTEARTQRQDADEDAISYYTQAVNELQTLRGDLVALNPEIQFSFREGVEPVYRQLVDLLLRTRQPNNLVKARSVIEALQLAELDNFFRDACSNAQPISIDDLDPTAAIVYPILLPDRLEIILKLPGTNNLRRYTHANVSESEVDEKVGDLLNALRRRSTSLSQTKAITKQFYDWLIQPFEAELDKLSTREKSQIKTLAFVLDGSLRNVSPAMFYDGQQYLVQRYAVAVTPGLQLFSSKPWQNRDLSALIAGATQAPSFQKEGLAPLENVSVELAEISKQIQQNQKLENQQFLQEQIRQQIQTKPFNIVHIATHGQFSSDPEQTYLLDWNQRINIRDLDSLLRSTNVHETDAIELLILSACETAVGDKRAALGLAGIAIRAGARSTLATLIQINDASTAEFMSRLYQQLKNPTLTKAEALRNVQLAFLNGYGNTDYNRPYHWAPFILVGNWL